MIVKLKAFSTVTLSDQSNIDIISFTIAISFTVKLIFLLMQIFQKGQLELSDSSNMSLKNLMNMSKMSRGVAQCYVYFFSKDSRVMIKL